jgi:uncharacterized membrane protein YidH (DUF202 family)
MTDGTIRQTSEREADPRVDLAVRRTELAEQRTLLAWLRTSLALMGAGVAFDKGIQFFHQTRLLQGAAVARNGHVVGLSLTIASILLLLVVLGLHMKELFSLASIRGGRPPRLPPTAVASALVILLGLAVVFVLLMSGG